MVTEEVISHLPAFNLFCIFCFDFSKSEDEWFNVSSHIGTKLRTFQITPEFYGAVFRVRTEKGNNVSEWQYSKPVQCVNGKDCFVWLYGPSILNV